MDEKGEGGKRRGERSGKEDKFYLSTRLAFVLFPRVLAESLLMARVSFLPGVVIFRATSQSLSPLSFQDSG